MQDEVAGYDGAGACDAQAYTALLHAAVKCGESELAVDVYGQMGREGMRRDCAVHTTMIEMFVKVPLRLTAPAAFAAEGIASESDVATPLQEHPEHLLPHRVGPWNCCGVAL